MVDVAIEPLPVEVLAELHTSPGSGCRYQP